jgi:archaellum biogenesis ATPase FlaH
MHVILGASHAGKSTMVRSIIIDYIENNCFDTIGLWLSEESFEDFNIEMCDVPIQHPDVKNTLFIDSDFNYDSNLSRQEALHSLIETSNCSLLIFDNITTSAFYEGQSFDAQLQFIHLLKRLAKKKNIPLIVVAHVRPEVGKYAGKLIDITDIRGNKTAVNLAEFCYVMQQFQIDDQKFNTLRIEKHRGYPALRPMWAWEFDREKRINSKYYPIDFALLKEKWNESDKLGKGG